MNRVYVNEKWRLGCHLCEYNCAFASSVMTDMAKAPKGKPIYSRIHIEVPSRSPTQCSAATFAAFSPEIRRKKFGGVV